MPGLFAKDAAVNPLERMRRRITRRRSGESWLQDFDDAGKSRMRVLGRRLVSLAGEYVAKRRHLRELQEEARHLGVDYGRELAAHGVSLMNALNAFIMFRGYLHEAMKQSPPQEGGTVSDFWSLSDLEDLVLLGLVGTYEQRIHPMPNSPLAREGG